MTADLITAITTGAVAIITAVFAGLKSLQAQRNANAAHARIDAMQQQDKQQGSAQ